ncbi:hypothetical protein XENOCAPTIV_012628, partial [Xenoophorus captivus]
SSDGNLTKIKAPVMFENQPEAILHSYVPTHPLSHLHRVNANFQRCMLYLLSNNHGTQPMRPVSKMVQS